MRFTVTVEVINFNWQPFQPNWFVDSLWILFTDEVTLPAIAKSYHCIAQARGRAQLESWHNHTFYLKLKNLQFMPCLIFRLTFTLTFHKKPRDQFQPLAKYVTPDLHSARIWWIVMLKQNRCNVKGFVEKKMEN